MEKPAFRKARIVLSQIANVQNEISKALAYARMNERQYARISLGESIKHMAFLHHNGMIRADTLDKFIDMVEDTKHQLVTLPDDDDLRYVVRRIEQLSFEYSEHMLRDVPRSLKYLLQ